MRSKILLTCAAALLASGPVLAGRMDQRAADLYEKGVRLIKSARYVEGEALIEEALSRGATEPNEAQGTESRYLERHYDPYYWLGVAKMELGEREEALRLFGVSETYLSKGDSVPVITKWPREYQDLKRRKAELLLHAPTD